MILTTYLSHDCSIICIDKVIVTTISTIQMLQEGRVISGGNGGMVWRVGMAIISHDHIHPEIWLIEKIDSTRNGALLSLY